MQRAVRFLGFAFANADLLLEIDRKGIIHFAAGATAGLCAESSSALVGKNAADLFDEKGAPRFSRDISVLPAGGRLGPLRLGLATGAEAVVGLCRLPQNDERISCTVSRAGSRAPLSLESEDPVTGLLAKQTFINTAAEIATADDSLSMVNVPGLSQHCGRLPEKDADDLLRHIGQRLRSWGAKLSGRLGDNLFGAIIPSGEPSLGDGLRKVLAEKGVALNVAEANVAMKAPGLSGEQRILALRYVVGNFESLRSNPDAVDLSEAFDKMLSQTHHRALALTKTVADGAFEMAFMPLIRLRDESFAHFECLARFPNQHTGETIQFAEALGISEAFDLAVAARTLALVETDKSGTVLAFNMSGRTLQSPSSFGMIAGLLRKKRKWAPRLLIEITETAEITDLESANVAVQTLREMGYRVGLDDFGAGAASFQYLQNIGVDFVKFDAKLIRKIGASKREDKLLQGLLQLCNALDVETIAEGIEDEKMFAQAAAFGFDLGQGYYFGRPMTGFSEAQAAYRVKSSKSLKRRGVRESWG